MSSHSQADPDSTMWVPERLEQAFGLMDRWTREGSIPAAAVAVGGPDGMIDARGYGRLSDGPGAAPVDHTSLFLVASITKPVTATAVLLLVERGLLGLDDAVAEYLPEFAQNGKQEIRIRHLLTHTSGLPDMLPNNAALRAAHVPFSRFVQEIHRVSPAFVPGTQLRYQSMGFAVLAEIVHAVAGVPLASFLEHEVFRPLGMHDTSLGCAPAQRGRVVAIRLEPESRETDWNWNSPYWLEFGAPWGGLITSAADFSQFCRMMLAEGTLDGVRLLGPATVRASTRNQLAAMPYVPEEDRRCRPWGLGWRLNWPGQSANFGDLLGPRTYGHWGATGTLCWIDPDARAFAIVFTSQPQGDSGRYLARISNVLASALAR